MQNPRTTKICRTQTPKICPGTRAGGEQSCRRGTCRRPGCIASAHKRTPVCLHAHLSINLGTHASNTNELQSCRYGTRRRPRCMASAHQRTSLCSHAHLSINLGTHASNTNELQARKPDLERCVMCDSLLLRLTTSRGATP